MSDNISQFVEFKLGTEDYGVDILRVKTIERLMPITRVPKAPEFVEGVINLRGEIVPVIDLKKRFNLSSSETSDDARIIIVNVEEMTVGMIVDSATEVIHLDRKAIEKAPSITGSIDAQYVEGVGKLDDRLLIILNLAKVLNPSEIDQLQEI